jgi:hypothetical protein
LLRLTILPPSFRIVSLLNQGHPRLSLFCPDCKERLYILPQDKNNHICIGCGQKFPVNGIYEQQQKQRQNYSAKLGTIDDYNYNNNSNSVGVFQPQNYSGRKPKSLVRPSRSPLEEELTEKGYTVIDSQWISQE